MQKNVIFVTKILINHFIARWDAYVRLDYILFCPYHFFLKNSLRPTLIIGKFQEKSTKKKNVWQLW